MFIFKTLLLVGVFAHAHANEDTVTLTAMPVKQLNAIGEQPPATLFLLIKNNSLQVGNDKESTIISVVLLEKGIVVMDFSCLGAEIDGAYIHGLTGTEEERKKLTNVALGQNILSHNKQVDLIGNAYGIVIRVLPRPHRFTPATVGFGRMSDEEIQKALESDKLLQIVVGTYSLDKEKNEVLLDHVPVSTFKREGQSSYYTATVTKTVNKSAPLFLVNKSSGKTELQYIGTVRDNNYQGRDNQIRITTGAALIQFLTK